MSTVNSNKYLFAYPKGGLTDTLYAINLCFNYALKHNRIVVIVRPDKWIEDDLSFYFQFDHPCIYQGRLEDIDSGNLTCFPSDIESPFAVESVWSNEIDGYKMKSKSTGEYSLCSMNFESEYEEDIIIYSSCYGGVPIELIRIMKFSPFLVEEYHKRMQLLDDDYLSLHIRNTDRSTNLEEFIEKHATIIDQAPVIFLASDNYKTIQYMTEKYGVDKIRSFSKITDNDGNNMHYYYNREELTNRQLVSEAIVDLLMLASAKVYIFSNIESSYSLLAQYLFENPSIFKILTSKQ